MHANITNVRHHQSPSDKLYNFGRSANSGGGGRGSNYSTSRVPCVLCLARKKVDGMIVRRNYRSWMMDEAAIGNRCPWRSPVFLFTVLISLRAGAQNIVLFDHEKLSHPPNDLA